MDRRRAFSILGAVVIAAGNTGAQEPDPSSQSADADAELVYRVFDVGSIELAQRLRFPEKKTAPAPDPFLGDGGGDSVPSLEAAALATLFESSVIEDLTALCRDAGLDVPDTGALRSQGLPFLFVRAPAATIAEIERRLREKPGIDRFENLRCRAVVVATGEKISPEEEADPEEVLRRGTVLSDLEVFTRGGSRSEIRCGSLASDSAVPRGWGSSLSLKTSPMAVEISLRDAEIGGAGPFRFDWREEFDLAAVGKTRILPATLTGENGGKKTGALLLRIDSIRAAGWDEPVEDLRVRKENAWRKLGPGYVPKARPIPDEYRSSEDWARSLSRFHFYDPETQTVYFEAVVPPGFLTSGPGSPYCQEVSTAGFEGVFSTTELVDARPIFEGYGADFRPGDVAVYSVDQSMLYVRATPEQIALIGMVVGPVHDEDQDLVRLRIATLETAEEFGTFSRRGALRDLNPVGKPDSRALFSRSGQRAQMEGSGDGGPFVFYVDPVVGPDEHLIDFHVTFEQPNDLRVNLRGALARDQTIVLPIGPPPAVSGSGRHRFLALRADLVGRTGSWLPFEPYPPVRDWTQSKPATTPWEKRGSKFKLVPVGPISIPAAPRDPRDPFSPGPVLVP